MGERYRVFRGEKRKKKEKERDRSAVAGIIAGRAAVARRLLLGLGKWGGEKTEDRGER